MSSADRIYTALCGLFVVLIVTGNLVYQKFVVLPVGFHTFEMSIGAILYPFTFMISDLLAEFYGRERARFCVKLALTLNVFIALLIFAMDKLQATSWSTVDTETFHHVFGHVAGASLISVAAAYVSQRFDISAYLFVREKTGFFGLSNWGSTSLSLLIDTCIVYSILAFFELIPTQKLGWLVFNGYLFKMLIALCNVPVFYLSLKIIRNRFKAAG